MKWIYTSIIVPLFMYYGLVDCGVRPPSYVKTNSCTQPISRMRVAHKKGEPLRILFVVEGFPYSDQPFILDQITGLIDRGHDVYIAAAYSVQSTIVPEPVYQYDLIERTIFFGRSNFLNLLQNHATIPHINTFDVIYCQFGNIGCNAVRFKRFVKSVSAKIVTCWRGALKEATMMEHHYASLFARGDLFLPVCEFLKQYIIDLGCDERKIQVMYSGINYDCYVREREVQSNDTINLISICRLVEKKGIEYAIRAVASVIKKYPNIRYTIVGDGPLKEDLEFVVDKLQMQSYIKLIGSYPHEKISKVLDKADIFLSPSVTTVEGNQEGIANSLKEAMASGVLVIATDHAGTAELVEDGVSGFLVPERDVEALAEKICYIISHPEERDGMRTLGQRVVQERFCLSKTIDQFISIIEEVCAH